MENIYDWFQDYFDETTKNCPNCNKRTILSYPTTICGHCQTIFANKTKLKPMYSNTYNHCQRHHCHR
jgi:hypothetical protein